jgi:hypothetical protein
MVRNSGMPIMDRGLSRESQKQAVRDRPGEPGRVFADRTIYEPSATGTAR